MNKLTFLLVLLLFISGCAANKTQNMLNSRMGKMNYEEAIERFGPPTRCAEAGITKSCSWIYGSDGSVIMPIGRTMVAAPSQESSIRLNFKNNLLSYWELNGNWE